MVLVHVALVILLLLPSKWHLKSFNDGYLEKDNTLPIKGLFVILVFLFHWSGFVSLPDRPLNNAFLAITRGLGYLVNVMFLFYSGFGIMKSLQMKGEKYAKGFFLRRFLPLYFKFATALLVYMIANACLGFNYDWQTIVLSFVAWNGIGNYCWFMFVTFALYLLFIIAFLIPKLSLIWKNVIFSLLSIALLLALYFSDRGDWWWNTMFCFNLGMWYCLGKGRIDALMRKHLVYWISFVVSLGLFILFFSLHLNGVGYPFVFMLAALFFGLTIILFTMKFQSRNPVLAFLGKHVFGIYIFQGLAFVILYTTNLGEMPYLHFLVALSITFATAFLFDFLHSLLSKKYLGWLDGIGRSAEKKP